MIESYKVRVDWLWQDPLPASEEVLLSVAGTQYATYLLDHLRRRGFLSENGDG
ncbi:MAG TPA: hypothetical protein VF510_10365 [Ktedonobacterales bacterium]